MSDEDQRVGLPDASAVESVEAGESGGLVDGGLNVDVEPAPDGAASGIADTGPQPDASARTTATGFREMAGPLAVAASVLVADQVTKSWVQRALADGHTVDVVGSLRLNLTYNSGMAFSRGKGLGPVIGVLALVLIVAMLASLRREGSRLGRVALGLVIGGAAGNIVDRVFRGGDGFLRGKVIDFIDAQFWPVFNVADIAVTVGGLLLVLGALVASRRQGATGSTKAAA